MDYIIGAILLALFLSWVIWTSVRELWSDDDELGGRVKSKMRMRTYEKV